MQLSDAIIMIILRAEGSIISLQNDYFVSTKCLRRNEMYQSNNEKEYSEKMYFQNKIFIKTLVNTEDHLHVWSEYLLIDGEVVLWQK